MEMEVDSSIWTVGMKKFNDSRISSLRDNLKGEISLCTLPEAE